MRRWGVLLVILRAPAQAVGMVERAAEAIGVAPADLRRKLAGAPPMVLKVDTDGARIASAKAALDALGFRAAAVDAGEVKGDGERVVARRLELDGAGLSATAGLPGEAPRRIRAEAIELLVRGVRGVNETKTTHTTERQISLGRAVMSAGLLLTKKVQTTSTRTDERREPFLLIAASDGGPDVILYEKRLDYRFLGAEMQPAVFANFERTFARLRALAPGAAVDERMARGPFVAGLPATGADPVDLALHLLRLAARER